MITDAISVVMNRISLPDLIELTEDKKKARDIWETSRDVISYTHLKAATGLGISIGLGDVPFEKAMVFSWIKEGLESGRKT